jgi:4-hydroxybenzoate polyprenyltransferase
MTVAGNESAIDASADEANRAVQSENGQTRRSVSKLAGILGLIRFSHTLFALPFAALATIMAITTPLPGASGGGVDFGPGRLAGILLCMVFARSVAMAFNRLVDQRYDALNPRTAGRHLPAGLLGRAEVWAFTVFCAIGFVLSTLLFLPNRLPLFGAVPVLAFLCGYSLAKRFTAAAHLWLGIALALSPICGWLALRGWVSVADVLPAVLLAGGIAAWVTGFDIIYACQDADFDSATGLHSVPARLGVGRALRLAAWLHFVMVVILAALPFVAPQVGLGWIYAAAVAVVAVLLIYEHWLVSIDDLQRVNVAFFNVNVAVSLLLLVAGGLDCVLG